KWPEFSVALDRTAVVSRLRAGPLRQWRSNVGYRRSILLMARAVPRLVPIRAACGLAGSEFDDFRGNFLLPYMSLRRLQRGQLPLYLAARRCHSLHAGLVLR